jgi:hypothetical protein
MHGSFDHSRLKAETAFGRCPAHAIFETPHFPGFNQEVEDASSFYVGIEDPTTGRTDIGQTTELFEALAIRLNGHAPSAVQPRFENPNIPSGYTYLAQFAAHDLSINSEDRAEIGVDVNARNLMSAPLTLSSLYANGPTISSFCYQHAPNFSPAFARLRLERVGKEAAGAPRRDIGRLCEFEAAMPMSRPLTADARSDDNAVISQLVAMLSMIHNAAVDISAGNAPAESPYAHYKRARLAATTVYRSILRNDLLRRLLDPEIFAYYNASNDPRRFLSGGSHGEPVTREFAHAVFRIGHSMVRPFYKFNAHSETHPIQRVLTRTSEMDPREVPLDRCWIAQWSRFFDIPGATAPGMLQRSMKIGPGYSSALNSHFKRPYESVGSGLAMRDLQRSAVSGIRKLSSLREALDERMDADFPHRAWLTDAQAHEAALEAWARRPTPIGGFGGVFPEPMSELQIAEFARNPPLVLFALIEATLSPWHGERLGPLGSLILAETFFRALDDIASLRFLHGRNGEGSGEAANMIFGRNPPTTMPELVLWLDRNVPATEKVLPSGEPVPII